MLHLW